MMTEQQKGALVRVARHFADSQVGDSGASNDQEDPEASEDQDSGEEGGSRKKRKRSGTGSKKRHPWEVFMRLEEVRLLPQIEKHLRKNGTDPIRFLADDKILSHRISEFGSDKIKDALAACYQYTTQLEDRQNTDNVRWCFSMLMFFDLVKLIRPKGSGKVGSSMMGELDNRFGSMWEQAHITKKEALENIDKWSLLGAKVDGLCAEFGVGCLFFLGNLLTRCL